MNNYKIVKDGEPVSDIQMTYTLKVMEGKLLLDTNTEVRNKNNPLHTKKFSTLHDGIEHLVWLLNLSFPDEKVYVSTSEFPIQKKNRRKTDYLEDKSE